MNKIAVLILTMFISNATFSITVEERRDQILKILDEELAEVSRLNKRMNGRNPNLVLRIAEILLEKARHIKEVENNEFLTLSPEKRKKVNKRAFFKRSTNLFIQAQKTCFFILKNYKKFKGKGDVYFILAYNAKEFQKTKKARNFFAQSIKYSAPNSNTRTKAATALAEILYNEGSYRKAIPLFEKSLEKRNDMWWTKDAHNLAWCYFKVGKKTKAIDLMNKIYTRSKSPKYVDMSYNVERDLAFFYADTKRIDDAIEFFKKQGKSIATNLLSVSKYLINQGKFTSAEKTLIAAKKYELTDRENVEVNLSLLNLYERFGKDQKHLSVSNELLGYYKTKKLSEAEVKDFTYHVEKMAAKLQKQAVAKTYARQPKVRKSKANMSANYYSILAVLRPKDAHKSFYYGGEALYAAKLYNDAISNYSQSQEMARKVNDGKFIKLTNTALLVALGKKGVTKATTERFLIPSYLDFLRRDPRSKEANKIYQRLFNAYFTKGDMANSEATLISFSKNFPQDYKVQEAMLAKIIDYHREKKNKQEIAKLVGKIRQGDFKVTKKYAKRLEYILLTMQFENVEKANSKGDKLAALKGYITIYKTEAENSDAKKNAAYNIAVLFYEYGDMVRAYNWLERSFTHMSDKDVVKFTSSIIAMANSMLNSGYFDKAATSSVKTLEKICKLRSKNKETLFKNAVVIYLADGKHEKAESTISSYRSCGVSEKTVQAMQMNLVKYYKENSMWLSYEKKLQELERTRSLWPELIHPTFLLARNYQQAARAELAKQTAEKAFRFYQYSLRKGWNIPLEALDEVARIELNKLDNDIVSFNNYKVTFPENVLRKKVERKLKMLDRLTTRIIGVLKIGSGLGISLAYRKLVSIYNSFANELMTLEPPAGKTPEYISAFKKNMNSLAVPLRNKGNDFYREAKQKLSSQMILSPYNNFFFAKKNDVDIFFYPLNDGVLMDRGGQR